MEDINIELCKLLEIKPSYHAILVNLYPHSLFCNELGRAVEDSTPIYPNLIEPNNFIKLLECEFEWDLAINDNDTIYTTVMREIYHHCADIPSNRVEFINTFILILNNHYIDMEEYLIKRVSQIEWEY